MSEPAGLTEVDPPEDSYCPECGAPPTADSLVEHKLSNMGYLHDDVKFECGNGHSWVNGVPIGESNLDIDYDCPSCNRDRDGWLWRARSWLIKKLGGDTTNRLLIHRVRKDVNKRDEPVYDVHLKCPNCYFFKTMVRKPDDGGTLLIGYPEITGQTRGAQAYGYPDEK